jgi:hypothetical protein
MTRSLTSIIWQGIEDAARLAREVEEKIVSYIRHVLNLGRPFDTR